MASLHCLLTVSENDIRASSERQICGDTILKGPIRFLFPEMGVYLTRIMNGEGRQVYTGETYVQLD